MFDMDEDARLSCDGALSSCRITGLSMSSVRLVCPAGEGRRPGGSPSQLHVDWLGWTDIAITSRSEDVVLARLQPSIEQHRRLVVRLFSASYGHVSDTASFSGAFAGLARRGFRGN